MKTPYAIIMLEKGLPPTCLVCPDLDAALDNIVGQLHGYTTNKGNWLTDHLRSYRQIEIGKWAFELVEVIN